MVKMSTAKEKKVNIKNHSVNEISEHGLKHGGIHIVSVKGHGKSRLLFSMARELRRKSKVLIFDGSETWLYAFDRIPVFTVHERDIVAKPVRTVEEIERYRIKNGYLIEYALMHYKDILFRLKTRKPSKRGFFVRTVVNYLDTIQRESRQTTSNNEANGYVAYFIEEAQDCFNSRSTTRLESEEFLTVFNESRNQREAFFTASQRLTDFSKTIRTKQTYCIGKIPEEDKAIAVRRIERKNGVDFTKMKPRTWLFNGEIFNSPDWKQNGKPYQINKEVKKRYVNSLPAPQPKKKLSLTQRIRALFWLLDTGIGLKRKRAQTEPEEYSEEDKEFYSEEEELDNVFWEEWEEF